MINRTVPVAFEAVEARLHLSAGDLDSTFGTGGVVIHNELPSAGHVLLQRLSHRSYKLLVLDGSGTLDRFNLDGSLDATFGVGGRLSPTVGARFGDAALAPDGTILLTGITTPVDRDPHTSNWYVERLNGDGTPATTFGQNGFAAVPPPIDVNDRTTVGTPLAFGAEWGTGAQVAVAPDGKILLAGGPMRHNLIDLIDPQLVRLNADGTPDTGFGRGGVANESSFWRLSDTTLLPLPDGRVIFAGRAGGDDFGSWPEAIAFTPQGTVESTSGVSGFGGGEGSFLASALRPDGTAVLAADGWSYPYLRFNGHTVPFDFNNALHADLYPAGDVTTPNVGNLSALLCTPDGKTIVIATGGTAIAIARVNPDGTPDNTFGDGGTTALTIDPGHDGWLGAQGLSGIVQLPDGNLLAAGGFRGRLLLVRFQGGAHAAAPRAPRAVSLDPDGIPPVGTNSYGFGALFVADRPIDVSSFDDQDVVVTGANGYHTNATFSKEYSKDVGSNRTPAFPFYTVAAPTNGGWGAPGNVGDYTVRLRAGQVRDVDDRLAAGQIIGTFHVAPNSVASPAHSTTRGVIARRFSATDGAPSVALSIRWSASVGVDASSFGDDDLLVTSPDHGRTHATFVRAAQADAHTYDVTYFLTAPGGVWSATDNGTYTLSVSDRAIQDANGNSFPSGQMATFTVALPKHHRRRT